MQYYLWLYILATIFRADCNFTKVIVPAVYREWVKTGPPDWMTNETLKSDHGYTTFLYQKTTNASANYLASNRGCENGAYYQYIVDHYDNFPDIAFFIHGIPNEHNDDWLDMVKCVRPNATYFSLNTNSICRESWNGIYIYVYLCACIYIFIYDHKYKCECICIYK